MTKFTSSILTYLKSGAKRGEFALLALALGLFEA